MANEKAFYRRKGDRMDYTCTTDVSAGDVVLIGSIYGVAEAGGVTGDVIAVSTVGVFELTAGAALAQGAKVYLSGGKVVATGDTNQLGVAWSAAANGEPVLVKINA